MQDEFIRDYDIIDLTDKEKELELVKNIINVKEELKNTCINFEFASEEKLIDYYTYKIKALHSKLEYLLKLAKIQQIEIDMINEMKIRLYNEKNKVI